MIGNLIIISAPSGAGKTTLVACMLERLEGVQPSISYTARAPRPGEQNGVHYCFVTRTEFEMMIARGEFLEWAEVHGNLYGTPRRAIEEKRHIGLDVVLTIDVQGAANARRLCPEAVSVFILPPSRLALESRLNTRGTNQVDDLRLRLRNASYELEQYKHFDYVVINDEIGRATEELIAIVRAARCYRTRRVEIAENILKDFAEINGGE